MKQFSKICSLILAMLLLAALVPTARAASGVETSSRSAQKLGAIRDFFDYNKQQGQFWDWFDDMSGGNGPSSAPSEAPTTPAPVPETPMPSVALETPAPSSAPAPESSTVIIDNSTTIIDNSQTYNDNRTYYNHPTSEPSEPAADEFIYVNGERYRRVDEDGELFVNDQMYVRDDPDAPKKEGFWDLIKQHWELNRKMLPYDLILLAICLVVGGIVFIINRRNK